MSGSIEGILTRRQLSTVAEPLVIDLFKQVKNTVTADFCKDCHMNISTRKCIFFMSVPVSTGLSK